MGCFQQALKGKTQQPSPFLWSLMGFVGSGTTKRTELLRKNGAVYGHLVAPSCSAVVSHVPCAHLWHSHVVATSFLYKKWTRPTWELHPGDKVGEGKITCSSSLLSAVRTTAGAALLFSMWHWEMYNNSGEMETVWLVPSFILSCLMCCHVGACHLSMPCRKGQMQE